MGTKERLLDFIAHKNMIVSEFERICGLSNGYVGNMKNTVGRKGLNEIRRAFPDLNPEWLLTGRGEMINPISGITQNQNGGNHNSQTVTLAQTDVSRFIDEISAQRRMTEKAQEQIDRLLTLLENK